MASSSFLHAEPWLAFNMIQTCIEYEQIPTAVAADYGRTPVKPVVMAEGGYEGVEFGKRQTAREIRQQVYWTHLAGGHHVYGHNDAWTAPQTWETWVEAPGAQSLRVFRDILTRLPEWWQWLPDAMLSTDRAENEGPAPLALRSATGAGALLYFSAPGTASVRLNTLPARRPHRAVWIDPRNGAQADVALAAQPTAVCTTPPGWEDALLWIGEIG